MQVKDVSNLIGVWVKWVSASNYPPMGIRRLLITRLWMGMGISIVGSLWACRGLVRILFIR